MSPVAASSAIFIGLCKGSKVTAVRALRRCSQHHKRISQNRECAAEVDFPKPGCIEAESIPKLNLCNKIAVPLALRKPAWTG